MRRCTAIPRQMISFGQDDLRDGLKTRVGIESRKAWPNLLFSDEALRPGVGFKAPQVGAGACQRRATKRQGGRMAGQAQRCPFPPGFFPRSYDLS